MPDSAATHAEQDHVLGAGTPAPRRPPDLETALRRIPPLPFVTSRALAMLRDPGARRSELAHVLSLDEGMTALFLRMVNSAYYGLPRRITSLDEAIGYLGFENTKAVLFAVSVRRFYYLGAPAYLLDRDALWRHSVAVASGSAWIAQRRAITPVSEVYVAGLLHDVGKLVLDIMVGHEVPWATVEANGADGHAMPWTEIERRTLGCDHAELGAHAVQSWRLPQRIVEAVRVHHAPRPAVLDPHLAAAVHLANAASLMAGVGLGIDGLRYPLDEEAVRQLEWTEDEMAGLLEEILRAVRDAERIFAPRPR